MYFSEQQKEAIKAIFSDLYETESQPYEIIHHRLDGDTVAGSFLYYMGGEAVYMDVLFNGVHLKRFCVTKLGGVHERTLFNFEELSQCTT